MNNPLVSLVIPTFNAGIHIGRCLQSVKTQTYKNTETIVVDDPLTTDNTRAICAKYGVKLIIQEAGMAESRNVGVKSAGGEFIYHIDADMELSHTVIKECVEIMNNGDIDCMVVPEVSVGDTFWAKCKGFEKQLILGDGNLEAARFYRRKVFDRISLYDPNLEAAEDYDFACRAKKAGFKTTRCNSVVYHHEGDLTLISAMKKKYRYGKTIMRYFNKHPQIARQQFFPLRAAYLRNWRMFIQKPIIGSGFIVMKICEYAAGAMGLIKMQISDENPF